MCWRRTDSLLRQGEESQSEPGAALYCRCLWQKLPRWRINSFSFQLKTTSYRRSRSEARVHVGPDEQSAVSNALSHGWPVFNKNAFPLQRWKLWRNIVEEMASPPHQIILDWMSTSSCDRAEYVALRHHFRFNITAVMLKMDACVNCWKPYAEAWFLWNSRSMSGCQASQVLH